MTRLSCGPGPRCLRIRGWSGQGDVSPLVQIRLFQGVGLHTLAVCHRFGIRHGGDLTEIHWTLQTLEINKLTDYYKNPRQLTEKQFKQLKKSLDKFGIIDKPIINADESHTVIGGHQRLRVLRADGVKEIECWIPDRVLTDKEVEELNVRLNKNTGEWSFDVLANEFEFDDLIEWGFDPEELGVAPDFKPVGIEEQGRLDEKKKVTCPECGHEFTP